MATKLLSDEELVSRLGAHPQLRNRMESLLLAVEDEAGELREADAAELRVRRNAPDGAGSVASMGGAAGREERAGGWPRGRGLERR
jgi:hypothetical protein